MNSQNKTILTVLIILALSLSILWLDTGTLTGQLSMQNIPQVNIQQLKQATQQIASSAQQTTNCCDENKAAITRLSVDLQGLRGQTSRPTCCNDNSAAITRLTTEVERLRNQPASSGGGVTTTNCCNENRAEIIRLSQQASELQSRITSLERHVQDLELDAHREAQASGDTSACTNVGASAEQMNCQEACEFRNQRCTRAELIRFRVDNSQRMAPQADACTAPLRPTDTTYSYSYICRCCP